MTESLHTKYRPKRIEDLIGQNHIKKSLRKVLNDKRAHSFIFSGPSGVGKTTLSRIFGHEMANQEANIANIVEIDAASNSGVDDIRNVVNKSMYRALGLSPIKTIIIDEAQKLSSSAWTALLKPIEEPPSHIYWCLCTTDPHKIPKAIETRCIKFDLRTVDEVEIFGLLEKIDGLEKFNTTPEILEAIAENSSGSPRQALTNLELCHHVKTTNEARELMRSALQMKGPVDLARLLIDKRKPQWTDITKCIAAMENIDAEGIRIVIVNYLAVCLMKAKNNDEAKRFLSILEGFSVPYTGSDKLGPLFISIGLSLGLDQ